MWPFEKRKIKFVPSPDSRCRLEKDGFKILYGEATKNPGQDWPWVLSQFEGWSYWNPGKVSQVAIRRKCWPYFYTHHAAPQPRFWRIWDGTSLGYATKWFVGFGGMIGAEPEDDDWVQIGSKKYSTCGISWQPDFDDMTANDWERIDEIINEYS